jgi:hypothetical protein
MPSVPIHKPWAPLYLTLGPVGQQSCEASVSRHLSLPRRFEDDSAFVLMLTAFTDPHDVPNGPGNCGNSMFY